MKKKGWSNSAIARHLHIHGNTVRKYLSMEQFVDRRRHYKPSVVELYRTYLERRWAEGCTMVKTLYQEVQAQGFTGSYKSVWMFTRTWPLSGPGTVSHPVRPSFAPRTPWQAKRLLLRPLTELSAQDAAYLEALYQISPEVKTVSQLCQRFLQMLHEHTSEGLDEWLQRARESPIQEVHRFALGLLKEFPAVHAAFTEPWSTAPVEGHITRLKYLKRQMYGRAKIDLLRLRVLHPT